MKKRLVAASIVLAGLVAGMVPASASAPTIYACRVLGSGGQVDVDCLLRTIRCPRCYATPATTRGR